MRLDIAFEKTLKAHQESTDIYLYIYTYTGIHSIFAVTTWELKSTFNDLSLLLPFPPNTTQP